MLYRVADVGDGNRVVQGIVNAVRDGNVRLHESQFNTGQTRHLHALFLSNTDVIIVGVFYFFTILDLLLFLFEMYWCKEALYPVIVISASGC